MGGGGLSLGSSVSKILSVKLWLVPVLLDTVSSISSSLYLFDDAKIGLLFFNLFGCLVGWCNGEVTFWFGFNQCEVGFVFIRI